MGAEVKAASALRMILLDIHSDLEIYDFLKHEKVDARKKIEGVPIRIDGKIGILWTCSS